MDILAVWILVEVFFFIIYSAYLKPRAKDVSKKKFKPYRDYNQESLPHRRRHLLFVRILERLEALSCMEKNTTCFKDYFEAYMKRWFSFDGIDNQLGSMQTPSPKIMNRNDTSNANICCKSKTKVMSVLDYKGVTQLFSWAFFDKLAVHLENWEQHEMDIMMHHLKEKHDIIYPKNERTASLLNDERSVVGLPRCHSLEEGDPLHRPFLFYVAVWILRQVSYIVLLYLGYRRFYAACPKTSKEGKEKQLSYWYKPGSKNGNRNVNPILFFHGIAPAGLLGYIPLLKYCLHGKSPSKPGDKHQTKPIFLFENLPITYYLSFEALSEEETVHAIEKALKTHGFHEGNCKLTLFGHSFGSFQMTWLLYAKQNIFRSLISKVILLDPVSILLSNPDVLVNFIYGGGDKAGSVSVAAKNEQSNNHKEPAVVGNTIIRLAASSELFIQHYLRRHFAWYNSELWIEDIPKHVDVHVFLSEIDAIINAEEVKRELDRHKQQHGRKSLEYTFWKGHGHGDCITDSTLWCDISNSLNSSHDQRICKMD